MTRWPYGRWRAASAPEFRAPRADCDDDCNGPNRSKCPGRTFARFCILFSAARQGGAPNSAPPPWPPGQPGWGAARGAPRNGHGRASARLPPSLRHHAAAMPPSGALSNVAMCKRLHMATLERAPLGGIAAAWWRSDGGRRALALPCPLRGAPRAAPQPGCPGGQGGGAELGAPPWRAAEKRMQKRAKVRPGHLLRFGPLQSSSQSARGARNSGADAARQRP